MPLPLRLATGPAIPWRTLGCIALLGLLSACASQGTGNTASQEAARYAAHARGNYVPPGPPNDPWGPYIKEASGRYDVPTTWIRAVMHQESGGSEYQNGKLVTSSAGAMGLMQVMPETYDELRSRYNLGDDPYDPHDNILAGTAYLREMYDIYGAPGFLAAYNAGPRRLDDYLSNNRPLPDETRRYVAMIGPNIAGVYPGTRSPAEAYAMNVLPINIPPGTRYGRSVQVASNRSPSRESGWHAPVQVAQLPEPPAREPLRVQTAAYIAPPPPPPMPQAGPTSRRSFRLIQSAQAEPMPERHGGPATGQWAIQVGAFANEGQAHAATGSARSQASQALALAHPVVAGVHQGHNTLYRARLTGLSREAAVQACEKLSHGHTNCIVLSPESQS